MNARVKKMFNYRRRLIGSATAAHCLWEREREGAGVCNLKIVDDEVFTIGIFITAAIINGGQ